VAFRGGIPVQAPTLGAGDHGRGRAGLVCVERLLRRRRADRHRDTDYQLAGFRILRLVWDDLHPDEVARTAGRVRAMLAT